MPRDGRALVWDARRALARVQEFSAGKSFTDYESDALLRSAIERQVQIIGEALNQLARVDPDRAARIPDLRGIIAVRNIIVHGYATLDNTLVWAILGEDLDALDAFLSEFDG